MCSSCETKDCIRGNTKQRGCELDLFLPQKVGNLDCTLCMDCVKACPHDNVAIYAVSPMREVARDPLRSSIRRLSSRIDIASVTLIIVLAAFLNAAAMITPGAALLAKMSSSLPSAWQTISSLAAIILVALLFAALVWVTSLFARKMLPGSGEWSTRQIFTRSSLTLVPLGLGMWAAHLVFHLLTTWQSAGPLVQQFAHDLGWQHFAQAQWSGSAAIPPTSLLALQLFFLDAGLVLTLYAAWRLACEMTPLRSLRIMLPWTSGILALYLFGFWVLLEPMQMRGMRMPG